MYTGFTRVSKRKSRIYRNVAIARANTIVRQIQKPREKFNIQRIAKGIASRERNILDGVKA